MGAACIPTCAEMVTITFASCDNTCGLSRESCEESFLTVFLEHGADAQRFGETEGFKKLCSFQLPAQSKIPDKNPLEYLEHCW